VNRLRDDHDYRNSRELVACARLEPNNFPELAWIYEGSSTTHHRDVTGSTLGLDIAHWVVLRLPAWSVGSTLHPPARRSLEALWVGALVGGDLVAEPGVHGEHGAFSPSLEV
jgi:hypothetical protein